MIYLVALIVLVGVVASGTRLATTDEITGAWRHKLRQKYGPYGFIPRLLSCNRCTAVWVSLPPTALFLASWAILERFTWWECLIAVLAWPMISFGVAYYAYLLILRGEGE